MASELITSASKPRGFLATPSYLRLWFAGGIGNAMRWLELLVAGIFTYEVTQSTVLVALVTVARSLPMLFIGTIAGVIGEALNRKRLLLTQLFVMAVSSAVLCALHEEVPPVEDEGDSACHDPAARQVVGRKSAPAP